MNDPDDMTTVCSKVGVGWKAEILATRNLHEQIENWKVQESWTSSDHRAITMKITLRKRERRYRRNEKIKRYNTAKANWETFQAEIRKEFEMQKPPINRKGKLIGRIKSMMNGIRRSCEKAMPVKKKSKKKVP